MRTLLFLLAFILASSSAALLGAKKCTYGPSYWCQNLRNSKECSATEHCIQRQWTHLNLPEDDDDVCTICKNMVQQARDTLQSNETQLELKEVFEGSCKLIPVEIIQDECITLVDEFVVELVETLASEMNPQMVCATAGLCNSARIDRILAQYRRTNPKTECEICQTETRRLVQKFREADENKILYKLMDICGGFSSYSDACKTTVMNHFDTIYETLTKDVNEEVCDLVGICSDSNALQVIPQSQNGGDIQCEFCEKVVQHWKDTWTANTTEEEFKQVLDALCHKLDANRVDHCLHIVDDYYIPWFNYILHELDPHMVCATFGLCNDGTGGIFEIPGDHSIFTLLAPEKNPELTEEDIPLTPLVPAISVDNGDQLIGGFFAPVFVKEDIALTDENDQEKCGLCQYTANLIHTRIGNDRSINNIRNVLNNVCSQVPEQLQDACEAIVHSNVQALSEAFMEGKGPREVCYMISFCSAPPSEVCGICQYALRGVESRIEAYANDVNMIKKEVKTLCKSLPGDLAGQCETDVAIYGDKIVQYFLQGFHASEICFELRICSQSTGARIVEQTNDDNKCIFCEYAVTTLEHLVTDPKNEDEVKHALDNLCKYLPKTYKDQCDTLVAQYTDQIIHLIINEYTPEQVCQNIHLCPMSLGNSDSVLDDYVHELEAQAENLRDQTCVICEYVIQTLDSLLNDKDNQEEIKNVLDTLCGYLPDKYSSKCEEFIDNYEQMIIDLITQGESPKEICATLGLCPNTIDNVPTEIIVEVEETESSRPYCTLCEYAIAEVDKALQNKKDVDEIKQVLDQICYQLRAPIGKQCLAMVDQYSDQIIHMFVNDYTPKEICQQMNLCDNTREDQVDYERHPNEIPEIMEIDETVRIYY